MLKRLVFDEAKHVSYADARERYAIDWDNGERKYKRLLAGVHLYESGLLEVRSCGVRDPRWRYDLESRTGLKVCLFDEITNVTFRNPLDGERIHRVHIKVAKPVLYVPELKRIYTSGYMYQDITPCFSFASQYAQPTSNTGFKIRIPNKQRFEEYKASLKEHYALGETIKAVGNKKYGNVCHMRTVLGQKSIPIDLTSAEAQDFCLSLVLYEPQAVETMKKATATKFELPYITVEEK